MVKLFILQIQKCKHHSVQTHLLSVALRIQNVNIRLLWIIIILNFVLALQEMLPTIMSQMGMSTDGLASEVGRRKFGARGDQQQSGNEQAGAEADDEEVPGMWK